MYMQSDDMLIDDMQSDNMLINDINFCDDRWMPYSLPSAYRYSRTNTNTDLVYVAIIYNLFFIIGGIYYFLVIM